MPTSIQMWAFIAVVATPAVVAAPDGDVKKVMKKFVTDEVAGVAETGAYAQDNDDDDLQYGQEIKKHGGGLTSALGEQTEGAGRRRSKTNIYFSGYKRKDESLDNGKFMKLLRPDLVKFIRCQGSECSDCPSEGECGWSGSGLAGHAAFLRLRTTSNTYDSNAAEFWIDCADDDGDWEVLTKDVSTNAVVKVYLVEKGGHHEGTQVMDDNNDGTWEIRAKAGSTRIRVVIEPAAGSDPDKTLKVSMKVRGNRVKSSVADCMDTKMCLKALSGTAGSQLRNDNRKQLACLKGDLSIAKCTAWTTCLDEPGKQVDKAMLLDILEAALPHSALAEFDTASITHTPDEASGDCLHPANDDPESWECECAEALEDHCETSTLSRPDCIRDAMCSSSIICDSWKNASGCPTALLDGNDTSEINGADDVAGDTLEETILDKRSC